MGYQKQILKLVAISLAIIVLISAALIILGRDITNKASDITETKKNIFNNSRSVELLTLLQSDAATSKRYLPQMENFLISKDQLLNFSKDLNLMAQQNNLPLNLTFKGETPLTGDNPRQTSISINSESPSNMENLIKFLESVENSRYFVKFNSLDINQNNNRMRLNFDGQVFSF